MSTFDVTLGLKAYLQFVQAKDGDAIAVAKKEYRKLYNKHSKKLHRSRTKTVCVSMHPNVETYLRNAAKQHNKALSVFLIKSSIAYLEKTYLVPNPQDLATLRQTLSRISSDIRNASGKGDYYTLAQLVRQIEQAVTQAISNPPSL